MLQEGVHSVTASTPELPLVIDSLVQIHASCILNDFTMATFVPLLSIEGMAESWQTLVQEAGDESRVILVHVSRVSSRVSNQETGPPFPRVAWPVLSRPGQGNDLEVSGVVSLSKPVSQTGPFRGMVQKLFVSPYHRRKHIATGLLAQLEKRALAAQRWSLMLDTTVGTPAEQMYPKLGYEVLGVVPEYGISPKDGTLLDEIFFWKDLRKGI